MLKNNPSINNAMESIKILKVKYDSVLKEFDYKNELPLRILETEHVVHNLCEIAKQPPYIPPDQTRYLYKFFQMKYTVWGICALYGIALGAMGNLWYNEFNRSRIWLFIIWKILKNKYEKILKNKYEKILKNKYEKW